MTCFVWEKHAICGKHWAPTQECSYVNLKSLYRRWFLAFIFSNPYVCIQVLYMDDKMAAVKARQLDIEVYV